MLLRLLLLSAIWNADESRNSTSSRTFVIHSRGNLCQAGVSSRYYACASFWHLYPSRFKPSAPVLGLAYVPVAVCMVADRRRICTRDKRILLFWAGGFATTLLTVRRMSIYHDIIYAMILFMFRTCQVGPIPYGPGFVSLGAEARGRPVRGCMHRELYLARQIDATNVVS